MTKNELNFYCEKYANVYLPCGIYGDAISLYMSENDCDRSTAFNAIGLKTGSEIAKIMLNK